MQACELFVVELKNFDKLLPVFAEALTDVVGFV
jgi:hypothetical protein